MPLAPRIVTLWETGSRDQLERLLQQSAKACLMVTLLMAIAILALSPYILAAFGPGFNKYGIYLYILAAAQLFNAGTGGAAIFLSMVGAMRYRLAVQLVTLAVQLALGVLLIPRHGAAGAAIALTAGILTWSFVHWLVALRLTAIDTSAFGLVRRWKALAR